MKQIFSYLITLIVGVVIGCALAYVGREKTETPKGELIDTDTTIVETQVSVGKEELAESTIEIAPPKTIKETEYIYIPEVKVVEKIIRDTVFLSIPRQYYFTEKNGVLIWHSGIQSRIDSLDYMERKYVIEKTYQKEKKNLLSIGMEANYSQTIRLPLQLEYERMINKWFSTYAYVEYEFTTNNYGIGAGVKASIGW